MKTQTRIFGADHKINGMKVSFSSVAKSSLIAKRISMLGRTKGKLRVSLSNELVSLLSDQLYQSPLKAIEELVVNSYDADATVCRISLPPKESRRKSSILVYDDGTSMDEQGLRNLWHIGRSSKRDENVQKFRKRSQIGKFGIGKIATFSIANRITFICKTEGNLLAVALNYRDFEPSAEGPSVPVELDVQKIDLEELLADVVVLALLERLNLDSETLDGQATWTLVILEDLKDKVSKLSEGRLKWVVETAMPLRTDFKVYLNGTEIKSAKAKGPFIAEFELGEIDPKRLENLGEKTGNTWRMEDGKLFSTLFSSGISGNAVVTEASLQSGKSSDILRSHGFLSRCVVD